MFCVNCFHETTVVINSRGKKKHPIIWRRRKCPHCGMIFTTYERPSLAENKAISLPNGRSEPFNLGRLIVSIAKAFSHAPEVGKEQSLWLAQTIEDILGHQQEVITPEDIAAISHQVLKRFDELAAMQYAAQQQLITSARRRGRPWLHGRGPQIRA